MLDKSSIPPFLLKVTPDDDQALRFQQAKANFTETIKNHFFVSKDEQGTSIYTGLTEGATAEQKTLLARGMTVLTERLLEQSGGRDVTELDAHHIIAHLAERAPQSQQTWLEQKLTGGLRLTLDSVAAEMEVDPIAASIHMGAHKGVELPGLNDSAAGQVDLSRHRFLTDDTRSFAERITEKRQLNATKLPERA